jgi:hypothetical protein
MLKRLTHYLNPHFRIRVKLTLEQLSQLIPMPRQAATPYVGNNFSLHLPLSFHPITRSDLERAQTGRISNGLNK